MKLKVFTKLDCPNCPPAKDLAKKLEQDGSKVEWFDLDQEEGLTEAVYFDVLSTPSLIVTDDDDEEIKGWRGNVPSIDDVKRELKH
ncbi:MAG: thioredoxin family protein [Candidatus Thorarchaeota archaeon]